MHIAPTVTELLTGIRRAAEGRNTLIRRFLPPSYTVGYSVFRLHFYIDNANGK